MARSGGVERATPIRSLAEIGVLAAYVILAPAGLEAVVLRAGLEVSGLLQVGGIAGLQVGLFLLAILLVKGRGETLGSIGLKRPESIARTVMLSVALASAMFLLVEFLMARGIMTRDFSEVAAFKDNLPLVLAWIAMVILLSGLVEEFVYRGVVMDRLARAFGNGVGARVFAYFGQAAIFGAAHLYGGVQLMLLAGGFALLYGLVFYVQRRNLWAPIMAHSFYNAARCAYAYYLVNFPDAALSAP